MLIIVKQWEEKRKKSLLRDLYKDLEKDAKAAKKKDPSGKLNDPR